MVLLVVFHGILRVLPMVFYGVFHVFSGDSMSFSWHKDGLTIRK